MKTSRLVKQLSERTLVNFRESLAEQGASAYRDFQLWASSAENPEMHIWVQMLGIPQLSYLTGHLLNDLVDEAYWEQLFRFSGPLNTYLLFETVSDNIAIGLYYHNYPKNDKQSAQSNIVRQFNDAMIFRLDNDTVCFEESLKTISSLTENISNAKQSLTEAEIRYFNELYLAENYSYTPNELEYCVFSALKANIETCKISADMLEGHTLQKYYLDSLKWRYEAVNRQFNGRLQTNSLDELLEIGAHSILVIPVLIYYIATLAEITDTRDEALFTNPKLHEALYSAALLVRLTNDLGTNLLLSKAHRKQLIKQLHAEVISSDNQTLVQALEKIAGYNPALTRLQKDIQHGEYNLCLSQFEDQLLTQASLQAFASLLDQLADTYAKHTHRIEANLEHLKAFPAVTFLKQIIIGFVKFHEKIYAQRFDTQDGDYATKPKRSTSKKILVGTYEEEKE